MIYMKIVPAIISLEKGCKENELTAKGDWLNKLECMFTVECYPYTKKWHCSHSFIWQIFVDVAFHVTSAILGTDDSAENK